MFSPLRIVFRLDGAGVYYDPAEPIMLDGLLAAACVRHHISGEPPARDEDPRDVPLPLKKWQQGGTWGWHASALFPVGEKAEALVYWRKRLRQSRIDVAAGSPNTTNGTWRDWQMPLPLLLCLEMEAWAFGDRREVRRELRRSIRWLGKKRAHGHGRVIEIEVDALDGDDGSIAAPDGSLRRFMPHEGGSRLVRPRPPYWSSVGRVRCSEIGEIG